MAHQKIYAYEKKKCATGKKHVQKKSARLKKCATQKKASALNKREAGPRRGGADAGGARPEAELALKASENGAD